MARTWLAALVICCIATPAYAGGSSTSFAGHWVARSYQHCRQDFSPTRGEIDCSTAGTFLTTHDVFHVTSDDGRSFTFTERIKLVSPGMSRKAPPCNPDTVYLDGPVRTGGGLGVSEPAPPQYIWRCQVISHGTGFIRLGYTHEPDFWIAHETATFVGRHGTRRVVDPRNKVKVIGESNPFPYPQDTGIPAVPGTYSGAQLLHLAHVKDAHYPPTYQVILSVSHGP